MNPNAFKVEKERLERIKNDASQDLNDRIRALTDLYFLHQFDVRLQAQYVREIQHLVS